MEAGPSETSETLLAKQFSDAQKLAYAGTCFLLADRARPEAWRRAFSDRLCAALEVSDAERAMIEGLGAHGVDPADLARALSSEDDQEGADIRFTVLTHLFILSLCGDECTYDARSRVLLRSLARLLGVDCADVVRLETAVARRLRLHDGFGSVRQDPGTVDLRNRKDRARRWLTLGLATIAGGTIVGVTAGLAAPLIATGIGAALTMFGVSGGVGVGAFMGGATGIAIIATGGALTGGGMSGFKMLRRTRGISQFEFISINDAAEKIEASRARRAEERRKRKERQNRWKDLKEGRKVSVDVDAAAVNVIARCQSCPQDFGAKRTIEGVPADKTGDGSNWSSMSQITSTDVCDLPRINLAAGASMPDLSSSSVGAWRDGAGGVSMTVNESDILWENESAFSEDHDADPVDADLTRMSVATDGTAFTDSAGDDGRSESAAGPAFLIPTDAPLQPQTLSPPQTDDQQTAVTAKQTNVLITIAGWVSTTDSEDDFTLPFSTLSRGDDAHGDQYALVWETRALINMGSAIKMLVAEITTFLIQQGIQTFLLPVLMAGLTGPLWMLKCASWLDNPWAVGLNKARKAGLVLADTLLANVQSGRPVTLVGFSLGARVIFHCLLELSSRGAYGIVEEAYLFGCPVIATSKEWTKVSDAVAGRLVNGYLTNDWILGVLYRTSSAASYRDVAGLRPASALPRERGGVVENVCLDGIIKGHLEYRASMPVILKHVGFRVTSLEFEDTEEDDETQTPKLESGKVVEEVEEDVSPRTVAECAAVAGIDLENAVEGKNVSDVILVDGVGGVSGETLGEPTRSVGGGADASKLDSVDAVIFEAPTKAPLLRRWFGRSGAGGGRQRTPSSKIKAKSTAKPSASAPINASLIEEEIEKERVRKIMESYWTPREVPSTLPPLVIPLSTPDEITVEPTSEPCLKPDDTEEIDVPVDSAVSQIAAPLTVIERENSSGDLGESCETSARTSVSIAAFNPEAVSPCVQSDKSIPSSTFDDKEAIKIESHMSQQSLASDITADGSFVSPPPTQHPKSFNEYRMAAPLSHTSTGLDTRDVLAANRWDGYQGPVPLSSQSSSSDIATGMELEFAMGALPNSQMMQKEWIRDPDFVVKDTEEQNRLLGGR